MNEQSSSLILLLRMKISSLWKKLQFMWNYLITFPDKAIFLQFKSIVPSYIYIYIYFCTTLLVGPSLHIIYIAASKVPTVMHVAHNGWELTTFKYWSSCSKGHSLFLKKTLQLPYPTPLWSLSLVLINKTTRPTYRSFLRVMIEVYFKHQINMTPKLTETRARPKQMELGLPIPFN